ncbi:MAG: sigma-70 family RNA polymerase sigma factor [Candidatus Gastranaerophilales bacterium]|nr:sigma-70 family RNA polymerase sigma factor [Candidatus Gastranaerophilales bacterium]
MIVAEDYKKLIEKLVTANKRFSGNEDLFEDFCAETLKRSFSIIKNIKDPQKINNYLNKVISTSIIHVLRTSGRLTKAAGSYQKIITAPIETGENPSDNGILELQDPAVNFVETISARETLKEIYDKVIEIDSQEPNEYYYKIFELKYLKHKRQKFIADFLGISQGEVSKRLFQLTKKINLIVNTD